MTTEAIELFNYAKSNPSSRIGLREMRRNLGTINKWSWACEAIASAAFAYEKENSSGIFKYSDLLEAARLLLEEEANGSLGASS